MIWALAFAGIVSIVVALVALRQTLGRERPDLLAWISFDDGPLAFSKTYQSGRIGPFEVGQSRTQTLARLRSMTLLEQDRPQLQNAGPWRISLPARSGGYVTYTVNFERGNVRDVRAYYAVLAGL